MISITTQMKDSVSPKLALLASRLTGAARARLHEAAAESLGTGIEAHIGRAAQSRHSTADRIRNGPAARTGHLEPPRTQVSHSATEAGGEVNIQSPGFRRAFGPLTIVPRIRRSLTVAVDAISYGKTVALVRGEGHPVFRPKGKSFLATKVDGRFRVIFLLRTSVTLKHDPGLLPAAEEQAAAAKAGIRTYVEFVVKNMRGAA